MPEIPNHGHKKPWQKRATRGFKKDGSTFAPFKGAQSSGDRRYDTRSWRRLRLLVLQESPTCAPCMERGVLKAANEVDHIEPHTDGSYAFNDMTNLWGLCKSCHATKSAYEGNNRRAPSGVDPRGWWVKLINKNQ